MCNFKKLWLWLAILGLLLLIFLCTFIHSNTIYDKQHQKQHIANMKKTEEVPKPSKYTHNNLVSNTSIVKDKHGVTISGLFGSKDTLQATMDKFKLYISPVNKGDIEIRDGVDDSRWKDILNNLAYYFSNSVEEGKLRYSQDGLFIDGYTLNQGVKDDIDAVLSRYKNTNINISDKLKVQEPITATEKTKQALYELLRLQSIEFENGKSDLKPQALPLLDKIANTLQTDKSLHITIEGHTDNTGNISLNEALSLERAYAVKNYLIQKGISKARLDTRGYGQTRPILPNTSDTNRQKNRRVEFKIKGEDNV